MNNLYPHEFDKRSFTLTIAKEMLCDMVNAGVDQSFPIGISLARNTMLVEIPLVHAPTVTPCANKSNTAEVRQKSTKDCDWFICDEDGSTAVAMIRNLEVVRTAFVEARFAAKKKDIRAALETVIDHIEFALVDVTKDGTVSWVNGNFVVDPVFMDSPE